MGKVVIALRNSKVYHIRKRGSSIWNGYYHISLCGVATPSDSDIVKEPPKDRRLCKRCINYMSREERIDEGTL